jgi:hypothetical protein
MKLRSVILFGLAALLTSLSACEAPAPPIRARVLVDGREIVVTSNEPLSVRQLLTRAGVSYGGLDRINPNDFTSVTDGMIITIVRVENRPECVNDVLAYATETVRTPDLPPGETRIMQPGVNGTVRVCYDVVLEDGVERSRTLSSRTIITPAVNQVVFLGVDMSRIEPIPVPGLIAYVSGGQARTIERNSTNQGSLPTGGLLDADRVFALSNDGRQLLFTRRPENPDSGIYNELWVLLDTSDPAAQPVRLIIDNVLTADWIPGQPFTFSYSTLQPRDEPPGYQALNDLYIARLDSRTGELLRADPVVRPAPAGVYGPWGTVFAWSPDGERLAWAQADRIGLVDVDAGALRVMINFAAYTTTLSNRRLWRPSLSWSSEGGLIAASVHGPPLADESPETSPAFDVAVFHPDGRFVVNPMIAGTGMWAAPRYSPLITGADGNAQGYIAYLRARDPINSVTSEYDLVLTDRDGSNPRTLFPGPSRPGIRPLEDGSDIAWSPAGGQIAVVYQGDIHIIDAETGSATVVTVVGNAQHPRWVR